MNPRTESSILADAFESTRQLTRFYMSKLKGTDMFKEFYIDGQKLNSAYWIIAHLVWEENFLAVKALGGKPIETDWLEKFGFGSTMPTKEDVPPIEGVLSTWKVVHENSMNHLKIISDSEMDKENALGFSFAGSKSYRTVIHHLIRHEAMHTGHLSWICKLTGVETF